MKRILDTIFLALASVGAMAQTLSVESVEVEKGKQAEIVVRASEVSDATALQFNLSLPKGFSLVENGATMGAASNDHLLIVETLGNGDHLLVLYSMDLKTFGEGELLRLPVTAGSEAGEFSGSLTTFRTATTDAVSHAGNGATFQITVKEKDDPAQEDYPVNYDKETASITRTDRSLNGVTMNGTTYMVPKDKLLYHEDMTQTFFAQSEQRLEPQFHFTGIWMNGYVYIDRDQDGQFSYSINDDGTPTANSDLMAYSLYDEKNSVGESVTGSARNVLNPPAFNLPSLADGFYRIRFKVDWSEIDPAGNTSDDNNIIRNGGGIMDARLRVFSGTKVNVQVESSENGSLTGAGGVALSGSKDFHTALSVEAVPANGYRIEALHVTHGNLTADPQEIHGVPQYLTTNYEAADFSNNKLTIPAEIIDGDVVLRAVFVKDSATGVDAIDDSQLKIDNWYSVDGVKLQGEPTRKGVYIVNGKKVVK